MTGSYIVKFLISIQTPYHTINLDSVCKNKSALQQLLYFDDLCSDREQIDSIYLDFSKAFDSASHTKLLLKLWSVGITGGMMDTVLSLTVVNACCLIAVYPWCP